MSMFKKAAALPEKPKAKKGSKVEVAVAGLHQLAMVHALFTALETVKTTLETSVKDLGFAYFQTQMHLTGTKPDSFRGIEGDAQASIELRKRGTNMPLNPAQVEQLRAAGFEPAEVEVVPELFGINPAHAGNEELLEKVSAALAGIVPEDFIIRQPKQVKYVVSDELLAKVCAAKAAPEVVRTCTVLAVKPTLKQVNINGVLDYVRDLLTAPVPQPAANEDKAEAAPASVAA